MAAKTIILVSRRSGMSREAFRDHYENHHVPLALQWFGFDKYVRNHVTRATPEDPGYDCIGEFWPHDPNQIARAAAAAGTIFEDDDATFMSLVRSGGPVREDHLAGAPRVFDPPNTAKQIHVLRGVPEETALRAWAKAEVVAGRAVRVTVDRPLPGGNLGEIAILHVWPGKSAPAALPIASLSRAEALVCDTPEEILAASRNELKLT